MERLTAAHLHCVAKFSESRDLHNLAQNSCGLWNRVKTTLLVIKIRT